MRPSKSIFPMMMKVRQKVVILVENWRELLDDHTEALIELRENFNCAYSDFVNVIHARRHQILIINYKNVESLVTKIY